MILDMIFHSTTNTAYMFMKFKMFVSLCCVLNYFDIKTDFRRCYFMKQKSSLSQCIPHYPTRHTNYDNNSLKCSVAINHFFFIYIYMLFSDFICIIIMFIILFQSKYMLTRFIMHHLVQNLFLYMTHNITFQLIHTGRSHSANMKHFDTIKIVIVYLFMYKVFQKIAKYIKRISIGFIQEGNVLNRKKNKQSKNIDHIFVCADSLVALNFRIIDSSAF